MEETEDDGQENMPGGNTAAVDLMQRARAPRRAAEDQMGASGPMWRTP